MSAPKRDGIKTLLDISVATKNFSQGVNALIRVKKEFSKPFAQLYNSMLEKLAALKEEDPNSPETMKEKIKAARSQIEQLPLSDEQKKELLDTLEE